MYLLVAAPRGIVLAKFSDVLIAYAHKRVTDYKTVRTLEEAHKHEEGYYIYEVDAEYRLRLVTPK